MESEKNLLECWIMICLKREIFPTAESNILQTRICKIVVHRTQSCFKYDAARSPFNVLLLLPLMGEMARTGW